MSLISWRLGAACDVLIAGAGPAGSRAAELLARRGATVVLLDPRAPWEKPCGGGLTAARRAWIGAWPERAFVATPAGRVLLCHGSPGRTNEFLYASELDEARRTFAEAERSLAAAQSELAAQREQAGRDVVLAHTYAARAERILDLAARTQAQR